LGTAKVFWNRSWIHHSILCRLSCIPNGCNLTEYLQQFIAPDLVQTIADRTDLYAQRQIAAELPKADTKHPPYCTVATRENYEECLESLVFTGIVRKPELEWLPTTRDILLIPIFS
jgi:hypothetical protein